MQGEENNVDRINQVIDIDTMRGAKEITVIKNASSKQQATEKKLSDIIYERYLKKYENKGGHFLYINSIIRFYKFGEIEEIYDERGEKQKNMSFDIIKINEGGEVQLFIKNTRENGELIIPSTVYDKGGTEYKVTKISKYSRNDIFESLKTLKFTGDFDNLKIESNLFSPAKNLQTVEINGNVRSLMIGSGTFEWCRNLKSFTILGNVEILTIDESAFDDCENLEPLKIKYDVKNLNFSFSPTLMRFPQKLLAITPENLRNKITFYSSGYYSGTLCIAKNGEIALSKKVLESLVKNLNMGDDIKALQSLQAISTNRRRKKLLFDDDLKGEFLEVEDEMGLYYERKKS